MEGYGRSTKDRDNNAPISYGADDCFAAAQYIQKTRKAGPLLVYGISSGALRAALFAQRHPELVARLALDAHVWTGKGSPTLEQRAKRLPEFRAKNRRPIDRAFVRSIFERDHPGTADDDVIEAFADAILALDDSVPTGTYVDMCANLPVVDPTKITVPTIIMRGAIRRHRELRRPDRVLQAPAQSRQAVRRDAGHRACLVPAEELRDPAAHPARLLHAAGADLPGTLNDRTGRAMRETCRDDRAGKRHDTRQEHSPPPPFWRSPALLAPAQAQDAVDVEKAKAEGKLVWYTSTPIEQGQKIIEAFQKEYGIKVEMFRSGGSAILRRFQQEMDAGRVAVDVLTHSEPAAANALGQQGPVRRLQAEEFRQGAGRRQGRDRACSSASAST